MQDMMVVVQDVDWLHLALWSLAGFMILMGLIGTVVPAVPGLTMILGGAVIAAWLGDFQMIGTAKLSVLAVLTIAGIVIEWVAQFLGAKCVGASPYGVAGVIVGTVIGLFFGLFGLLLFPLIGAIIGELIAKRSIFGAGIVGIATWLGMLVGMLVKLILGITMVGIIVSSVLGTGPQPTFYNF